MRHRIIPIGFDGPAQPSYRRLLLAKVQFGPACDTAPLVGKRVAGTEAKRRLDVSLGILGLAELNLGHAYLSVRVGQISIQFQRPLAFPDALRGAVGLGLDDAQAQMGERILGGEGQRLGQSRLSRGKPRDPIVGNKKYRDC